MRLMLEIDMANAAFGEDDDSRGIEVARILREAAKRIEEDGAGADTRLRISDYNGNVVLTSGIGGRVRKS